MENKLSFFDGNQGRALQGVVEQLWQKGFICYLAGGCVRDFLLQKPYKDLDIVTDAQPDQVIELFPNHIAVGKKFGIIVVVQDGFSFEVATFRTDGLYKDGRHPTEVQFATPQEDAQRRDFTINALFYDLKKNQILDYVDGKKDIQNQLLRAVGEPQKRFQEDYLRILRALRFQVQLNFSIEVKTWNGLVKESLYIKKISGERIGQELHKGTQANPTLFYSQLQKSGVWSALFDFIKVYGWELQKVPFDFSSYKTLRAQHSNADSSLYFNSLGATLAYLFLQAEVTICEQAFQFISPQEIKWNSTYLHLIDQICSMLKPSKNDEHILRNLAALPCWSRHWNQFRKSFRINCLHQIHEFLFTDYLKTTINDTDLLVEEMKLANHKPIPFLKGTDVLSLPPLDRSRILKEALDLQWEDKIKTKEEALNWLANCANLKK